MQNNLQPATVITFKDLLPVDVNNTSRQHSTDDVLMSADVNRPPDVNRAVNRGHVLTSLVMPDDLC